MIRRLRRALYIAVAAVLLIAAAFCAKAQPVGTVRVIQDADSDKVCSAVAIAPGYALTARHCLSIGMAVDGLLAAYVVAPSVLSADIALVAVPGLKCPCATLGGRPVHGTTVVAIGYPVKLEGAKRATEAVRVNYIGHVVTIAPWITEPVAINGEFIFTDKPILDHGDSGGGLFALVNERWLLVGVNAIGVRAAPDKEEYQASGFTPVDLAEKFLPRL